MNKKFSKKLKDDSAECGELKNETPFKGEEFVEELVPLLDYYFHGEFEFNGKAVVCKFANGQTFNLIAEEAK